MSIGRETETLKSEELAAELRRSKIGEFSHAVHGGGIEFRVLLGSAQVGFENTEAIVVFLFRGICLSELGFEVSEVVLRVQQVIFIDHLTDQEIVAIVDLIGDHGGCYGGEEEKSQE